MAATDHLPTVADVAALIRARTRDTLGVELGTFTANTRPTADQVSILIASEAMVVGLHTGDLASLACPNATNVREGASSVIAKRVAAIVEASYRPDEIEQGRTIADFYAGDATADLKALAKAAGECRRYTTEEGDDEAAIKADWFFPLSVPLRW